MAVQFNPTLLSLFQVPGVKNPLQTESAFKGGSAVFAAGKVSATPQSAAAATSSDFDPDLAKREQEVLKFVLGLLDGSISATGEVARKMYGDRYVRAIESTGAMFEGFFPTGLGEGESYTPAYGKFADRQNAMINAFHYAQAAAAAGKLLASRLTSDVLYPNSPNDPHNMHMAKADVENAVSVLGVQFAFMDEIVKTNEDGTSSFTGFEVSHDRFGKLLSVDASGAITLYDADGTAYSMADYDAARPDGVIPELANLVAGRSGLISILV